MKRINGEYECYGEGNALCACFYKDYCPNCIVRFMHYPSFTEVKPSQISGSGVFATTPIPKDTFIVTFCGAVVSQPPKQPKLVVRLNGQYLVMDAKKEANKCANAKFVNHSCAPNAMLQAWEERADQCIDGETVKRVSVVSLQPMMRATKSQ